MSPAEQNVLNAPEPMPRSRVLIMAGIVILVLVSLVALNRPGLVRFAEFGAAEFVQMMTPLILISLFVERALEIVIKGTRGLREDQLKHLARDHPEAKQQLTKYKAETRDVAFATALVLCIAISALGVRALELVTDDAIFATLNDAQRSWFQVIDVLLTGALLAGGADGLHKLVSVFTDSLDTLRAKAQKNADQGG